MTKKQWYDFLRNHPSSVFYHCREVVVCRLQTYSTIFNHYVLILTLMWMGFLEVLCGGGGGGERAPPIVMGLIGVIFW